MATGMTAQPYFGSGNTSTPMTTPTVQQPGTMYAQTAPMTAQPYPRIAPLSPSMPGQNNAFTGTTPTFSDIQKTLTPQTNLSGVSPEAQNVLDLINKQRDYYAHLGESSAIARATQMGNSGSSIEQFGIQQALSQTNNAALGATQGVLTQDMQNQLALKAQLGTLTSDEIASVRNMTMAQRNLDLQQNLGQQGIDLGKTNANNALEIAQLNARNQLIGGAAGILGAGGVNGILGNILGLSGPGGGGGGGMLGGMGNGIGMGLGNLFGSGGSGGGATMMGVANPSAGSPTIAGMGNIGPVGTGAATSGMGAYFGPGGSLFNTMGTSGLGSGGGVLGSGLGLGSIGAGLGGYYAADRALGATQAGDQGAMNVGAGIGGVGGSFFGPAGSAAGAALGTAAGKASNRFQNVLDSSLGNTGGAIVGSFINPISSLASAGNKISQNLGLSGGSGKSTMQYSGQDYSKMTSTQVATNLGKKGYGVDYDSKVNGSFDANYNKMLSSLSPNDLVTRYSQPNITSQLQTPLDKQNYATYQKLAGISGGQVDPTMFALFSQTSIA